MQSNNITLDLLVKHHDGTRDHQSKKTSFIDLIPRYPIFVESDAYQGVCMTWHSKNEHRVHRQMLPRSCVNADHCQWLQGQCRDRRYKRDCGGWFIPAICIPWHSKDERYWLVSVVKCLTVHAWTQIIARYCNDAMRRDRWCKCEADSYQGFVRRDALLWDALMWTQLSRHVRSSIWT